MQPAALEQLTRDIVATATSLKDAHSIEPSATVSYACIFPSSADEAAAMRTILPKMGTVVYHIDDVPVYKLARPVQTIAGNLYLLKVNDYAAQRTERGYVDFSLKDYAGLRQRAEGSSNFKITPYSNFEIIELSDELDGVRTYFPDLPLDKELEIP